MRAAVVYLLAGLLCLALYTWGEVPAGTDPAVVPFLAAALVLAALSLAAGLEGTR